jgi:hypothetical protein
MFDKVKIKENLGIIYFSKKEDKYYKIDSDTGERAEIDKSKISHQNV